MATTSTRRTARAATGTNGEGGIGPALNRQDKLFAHLNENYLRTVLAAGGRYVCGNPNSLMPVWSNLATPPGPLNYRQIDELIAFLRATDDVTYIIRDHELGTPLKDPLTGKTMTFTGWRDPAYQPAPDATPYPACWEDEFTTPPASAGPSGSPGASPAPGASGSAAPSASAGGGTAGPPISIVAQGVVFTTPSVIVPPNAGFQIAFDNQDAGVQHNVAIKDNAGTEVFKGDIFPGVETRTYDVPALDPGDYTFICTVHREHDRDDDRQGMTAGRGRLAVEDGGRWPRVRSQPGRRCRGSGPSSGCSTRTDGHGRRARPSPG